MLDNSVSAAPANPVCTEMDVYYRYRSGVPILLCGTGAGPQQGYAINIPYASV